jgi:23S rRNA (pseudouridine1915-N3)-methyltransferase
MRLRFVWIGKTKSGPIRSLIEDYVDRISKFAPVELVEIRDRMNAQRDTAAIAAREGEEILSRIRSDPFVLLLDEKGTELRSGQLAQMIERHQVAGTKNMTFLIGGHAGVSREVRDRADYTLALSRMTLTHEMARALLTEQVYRAFTIIKNLPYKR